MTVNISDIFLNITYVSPGCKCIVPEAVIPTQWRIMIVLNLVFTSLVYATFVIRKSETSSLKVMLEEIKKINRKEAMKVIMTLVWGLTFVITLVQPWTIEPYRTIQIIALIVLLFSVPEMNKEIKNKGEEQNENS